MQKPLFTLPELIAELKRENACRRGVYPRLISTSDITADTAQKRIDMIEFIISKLQQEMEAINGTQTTLL